MILQHSLGLAGVLSYAAGSGLLLGEILAQDGLPATPTTVLGAFIAVSVGAFSLLGWVVRTLFQLVREQGSRLDQISAANIAATAALRDAVIHLREAVAHIAEAHHREDRN